MIQRRNTSWGLVLTAFLAPLFRTPDFPPSPLELLLARRPRRTLASYNAHPRCPYADAQRRRKRLRKLHRAIGRKGLRS